ncbi:hypothetical protein [Gordonia sihwensis]|uniref:hypothetical protein n=1 Tax=Gordonia sihwensis TaxID=173559 RepID=UPI0005EDFBEE|nr:hypothetical protein [Gordonia sihwensis]KJR10521.1 hypothetical protein UG54_00555 [Gordonia sihwensis]
MTLAPAHDALHTTGQPDPGPRLRFSSHGLSNSGMVLFASKVQEQTGLRARRVTVQPRGCDGTDLEQITDGLLRRLRSEPVAAVFAYVDQLRRRYQIEAITFAGPIGVVTVNRGGAVDVTPHNRQSTVFARLSAVLDGLG